MAFLISGTFTIYANDGFFDPATELNNKSDQINSNISYTNIDGDSYVGLNLQTDFHIGKLGIGVDIPFLVNTESGEFRSDAFKNGAAVLRLIRSLSWGTKKRDPIYVKAGMLTDAYLGYGMLLNNYSNSISYERWKFGMEMDLCYNNFVGIEGIYSDFDDFSSLNLLALRPYVKPFGTTGIPILKTFDIGFNYITDRDNTDPLVSGKPANNRFLSDGITAYGVDMGVTPVNNNFMRMAVFMTGSMIKKVDSPELADTLSFMHVTDYDDGYGFSYGFDFKFKFLGSLLRTNLRIERMHCSDNFIPHLFDITYEINKDNRILALANAKKIAGTYGELGVSVLQRINVYGNLMIPDEISETSPASMQIKFDASKVLPNIMVTGSYTKSNLATLSDAFKFDQSSLAYARVAYKIYPFIYAGIDYRWTWAKTENGKFKATNFWSPYVGVRIDL